jgi:hypothetical protein
MSVSLITITKWVLTAVFLGGLIACDRANMRMIKRARESGYRRYWLANPLASLAGFAPSFLGLALLP